MQRIITEEQIPTGDFRKVYYVGAINGRTDESNRVTIWETTQPDTSQASPNTVVKAWTDVLINVEDALSDETVARLQKAVQSRRTQQQLD